ncbi:MAG: hypothetical protein KF752_20025 [Pirellulaceae bacterium]|nr:hypothetical protein [Pirellulaceae bacterium]
MLHHLLNLLPLTIVLAIWPSSGVRAQATEIDPRSAESSRVTQRLAAVVDSSPSSAHATSDATLDRVTIAAHIPKSASDALWSAPSSQMMSGRIVQFNATDLVIEVGDDSDSQQVKRRTFPSQLVQRVDAFWSDPAIAQAVERFDQQQYPEFIAALRVADLNNVPDWQQLILLGKVVQAMHTVGGPAAAGKHFLTLADSAPDMLYAVMPLCWQVTDIDRNVNQAAQEWLKSEVPAAQLMGASWLALGPQSQAAQEALKKLQSSARGVIAKLATIQSWRLVPPPDTMASLEQWFVDRDRLLLPLALGPTEFLADRLTRLGQVELALGEWLRIPVLHAEQPSRCGAALERAAKILESAERTSEAERIRQWSESFSKKAS